MTSRRSSGTRTDLSDVPPARAASALRRAVLNPSFRQTILKKSPELARGYLCGHPGARIGRGVSLRGPGRYLLAPGSCIRDGARLYVGPDATLTLGRGAAIGARCVVNVRTSISIGSGTQISWQCQLLDTDFHTIYGVDGASGPSDSPVRIGNDVLVGTGAILLKGVHLGDGAVVGAGSVVMADLPERRVVAGNPAHEVKRISRWQ